MAQYRYIIVVLMLAITAYFSYQAGFDACTSGQIKAVEKADEAEKIKVEQIIKWKEKTKVIYRDRIKTIKVAADPTGCLDADLRDVGLGSMLKTSDH